MLDIYDSTAKFQQLEDTVLEKNINSNDSNVLVESAWVEPINPKPPYTSTEETILDTDSVLDADNDSALDADDADIIDPERLAVEYRYHLRVQALKLDRLGTHTERQFHPIEGLSEGNDWVLNPKTDNWYIPSMDLPVDQTKDFPTETYDDTFLCNDITLNRCSAPDDAELEQANVTAQIQSDTGANANITSDISVLDDVQWVQPVNCDSAKKGATISIQAIGKYLIRGTTITINMYYSPDVTGTIISPTAIVRQNTDKFVGYQKYMNLDQDNGYILLVARLDHEDVKIPLYQTNDLCYHCHSHYNFNP